MPFDSRTKRVLSLKSSEECNRIVQAIDVYRKLAFSSDDYQRSIRPGTQLEWTIEGWARHQLIRFLNLKVVRGWHDRFLIALFRRIGNYVMVRHPSQSFSQHRPIVLPKVVLPPELVNDMGHVVRISNFVLNGEPVRV